MKSKAMREQRQSQPPLTDLALLNGAVGEDEGQDFWTLLAGSWDLSLSMQVLTDANNADRTRQSTRL